MYSANYFIKNLGLEPHPEGGYFTSSYSSDITICLNCNSPQCSENRLLWTSIYFLLKDHQVSLFHRLKSDELWYYQAGSSSTIYILTPCGKLITKKLGLDICKGELPQILVPRNSIFGTIVNNPGFSLSGCMVSPGFDYRDFEIMDRQYLLNNYPKYKNIILKLTKK